MTETMDKATLRLFSAIRPDPDSLDRLIDRIRPIKRESWAKTVRWLPFENIHLTLRFFGDTPVSKRQALTLALVEACSSSHAFELSPTRLMFLPSPAKTRVVAAGIQRSESLSHLAEALEKTARDLGFKPERRPVKPHITLGRCKPADFRNITLEESLFDGIMIPVKGFDLVQSTLSSQGASYKSLARIDFRSSEP